MPGSKERYFINFIKSVKLRVKVKSFRNIKCKEYKSI